MHCSRGELEATVKTLPINELRMPSSRTCEEVLFPILVMWVRGKRPTGATAQLFCTYAHGSRTFNGLSRWTHWGQKLVEVEEVKGDKQVRG